ncbi:MAG TPA: segregation/condensation protein A, partial [Tenericutes bacterium]|nr:segregation/condensation protein A [Mycoplasmatota bacterium]
YLEYIEKMEEMNLNIASEYLIIAAELIEMKSNMLLPKPKLTEEEEYEEDPKEKLIKRLLEYQKYKEMSGIFKNMEDDRKNFFSKEPSNLKEYEIEVIPKLPEDLSLTDLLSAFEKFLKRKEYEKPLNTKITKKEYSVSDRCIEIKKIIKKSKKIDFFELFEEISREYVVVTFLSILDLARKHEIIIKQDKNFNQILIYDKDVEQKI